MGMDMVMVMDMLGNKEFVIIIIYYSKYNSYKNKFKVQRIFGYYYFFIFYLNSINLI